MADPYKEAQDALEKIDVLSRISPCLSSDSETAFTLAVLMSIISDYAEELRSSLDAMARGGEA